MVAVLSTPMAFRAPVLGYNTNVRHKGRLFHIQTEDSGVGHPHVITHLFADGGRIVASKKTAYSDHLGADNLPDLVKRLMQAQHKQMFIALRDGAYDEDGAESARGAPDDTVRVPVVARTESGELYREAPPAQAIAGASDVSSVLATGTASSAGTAAPGAAKVAPLFARESGGQSLDEVILRYLAQEDREAP
jgi:hypothetical protein